MDQNTPLALTVVWTANVLGLIYNLPQMYHTYVTKRVDDISTSSVILRLLSSVLWTGYCMYFAMWDVGVSWFITLISSVLIAYYKVLQQAVREEGEGVERVAGVERVELERSNFIV